MVQRWKRYKKISWFSLYLLPLLSHASFIESTIGAAVIKDATAVVYNPAALTLLSGPQLINLDSWAYFDTKFKGQVTPISTNITRRGISQSTTKYFLPSLYLGLPVHPKATIGIALVANFFNRDIEQNAILRYIQSNNNVQDYDVVTSLGIKLTDRLAVGAGLNFSQANFLFKPVTDLPALNVPDIDARNTAHGKSVGWDAGLLYKLSDVTTLGFNYRSALHYRLAGKSVLEINPRLISSNYHFKFWSPARAVASMNHFLTSQFGIISTLQYIQWDIFKTMNIYNIATIQRGRPFILPHAQVPYHFRNTWLITLGSHYQLTSNWIMRFAATFSQNPANPHYQVATGDSTIVGGSTSYDFNKKISIDASYAHAFIKSQKINIKTRNLITGVNSAVRDALSIKLTINI